MNNSSFSPIRAFALAVSCLFAAGAVHAQFPIPGEKVAIDVPLKVSVPAGPMEDILNHAADIARKNGIEVKVTEINDWALSNQYLFTANVDANFFQSKAYVDLQRLGQGYDFSPVAKGVLLPSGMYSKTLKSLSALPDGATISIPSDLLNKARALQLLEKAGLVTLTAGSLTEVPAEVATNPHHYSITPLDSAPLAEALKTAPLVVMGYPAATAAGLQTTSALLLEDASQQDYALTLVARTDGATDERIKVLATALNSDDTRAFVKQKYPGFIPTW